MKYTISKTKDIALVRKLDLIIFPEDERIDTQGGTWWLVRLGRAPVGFAGAAVNGGHVFLRRAGILKDHRGKGLQRRLVRAREAWARKQEGVSCVITYVLLDNPASSNSLVRCGYKIYVPEERYAGRVIYFRKDIRG